MRPFTSSFAMSVSCSQTMHFQTSVLRNPCENSHQEQLPRKSLRIFLMLRRNQLRGTILMTNVSFVPQLGLCGKITTGNYSTGKNTSTRKWRAKELCDHCAPKKGSKSGVRDTIFRSRTD